MATNVSGVTSHFPDAENGFTTTTAGSIASAAVTVPLNSVSGYTNGQPVVLVIDPTDPAKKQTFTGIVDTSGVQITSVVWTAGTNQIHALGATVVDYATATHIAMISKGIQVEHEQDGTHGVEVITSRTEDTNPDPDADFLLTYDTSATALKKVKPSSLGIGDSWVRNSLPAVSSVTENGNRSADITFASTVASLLTPGMRLRTSRTAAAPTQSTSLNGTTQYYSKASPNKMTWTDDFAVSAWVKLTSYAASYVVSRFNGTSGWGFLLSSSGQVQLLGFNAGGANFKGTTSYQSIPLNKWVHIAAQIDMNTATTTSTTNYVMIDGVDVPTQISTGGTNPTALIQAGNLEIGAANSGTSPFPGKIAQVAIFNAKVTQATIRTYKNQGLAGTETSLASAYSFNNSFTDLNTTTPNDLTANGSAVATNADSPFTVDANGTPGGTYDYAIVTKVATTVATVQYPEGCAIPTSGGISAVDYSGVKAPFGMPIDVGRWDVYLVVKAGIYQGAVTLDAIYNIAGLNINTPVGKWTFGGKVNWTATGNTTADKNIYFGLSTSAVGFAQEELTNYQFMSGQTVIAFTTFLTHFQVDNTSATPYYVLGRVGGSGTITNLGFFTGTSSTIIARLAYL